MADSLNHQTYERLKKDIMTFALKPGEPVSAAKIAERYNVSRTPSREALVKLEAEALIDIYPQATSFISKIDVERVRQEWFIRTTLEMGMVDDLFLRVRESDVLKMRAFCQQMQEVSETALTHESAYQYLKCDNEFHAMTYHIAGQHLAADFISNTMVHYDRLRLLIDFDKENKDRTFSTHEQLIKHLENKEKEAYREMLRKHLDYITTDIPEMIRRNPGFFKE